MICAVLFLAAVGQIVASCKMLYAAGNLLIDAWNGKRPW